PERVETLDQQVRLGEARHRVVAHETGDGPGRQAGVEEDDRVGGANEPAGDGDLHPRARELAVEEPRALEAHEAVLQRVERLDRHAATFYNHASGRRDRGCPPRSCGPMLKCPAWTFS